jgi:Arginase family
VGALEGAAVVPAAGWQERIRFGCTRRELRAFGEALLPGRTEGFGTALLGSGDFHHVSLLLIERLASSGPFRVIVFDNHPDNMRYLFGIHCGSWVRQACRAAWVSHVHVVGICSEDVTGRHAWGNYLGPLYRRRLTYWCTSVDVRWARRIGLGAAVRGFASTSAMLEAFEAEVASREEPTYLSIDKDVLSTEAARTNWDQGRMSEQELVAAIGTLRGGLVGSDITGEVSVHRFRSPWKRWLVSFDRQPEVDLESLSAWQRRQEALNRRLLAAIHAG